MRRTQLLRFSAATADGRHVIAKPTQSSSGIGYTTELVTEDLREPFVRHTVTWVEPASSWNPAEGS